MVEQKSRALLSLLHHSGALTDLAMQFLQCAFACKGFIAGGFAKVLWKMNENILDTGSEDVDLKVRKYLETDKQVSVRDGVICKDSFLYKNRGDIDIYFDSPYWLDQFWKMTTHLRDLNVYFETSASGVATNITIDRIIRVQIIKDWVGTPSEIIEGFDLANSMVAYTEGETQGCFVYDPIFKKYEEEKLIHIVVEPTPYTVKRAFKYTMRHEYNGFTEETRKKFIDCVSVLIPELKKDPYYGQGGGTLKPITAEDIFKKYYNMLDFFTMKDAIFIASISNEFGYKDSMMKYLLMRSKNKGIV